MSEALWRVAERRILFGHQSVGANLIDGLRRLAREEPSDALRVRSIEEPLDGPAIADVLIGSNGNPLSKIAHFDQLMGGAAGDWAEVAFFKFCYVDFGPQIDVRELFETYRYAHEARARTRPGVIFVHVTAPLTADPSGPRGWVKRVLGSAAPAVNTRQHDYNELIRRRYDGREPLFDLARLEAAGGQSLAGRYTDDGGHLNSAGQLAVATELVAFLAALSPVRA